MFKLLTCAQGHYWEKPVDNGDGAAAEVCPVCGRAAETMPILEASDDAPPAPAEPPAPPPLRDGEGRPVVAGYDVQEHLGRGPTGVHHYKARQVLTNRVVLLKVVFAGDDPGQLAWGSLRNEATALGRLDHPHVVQILDAGERDRQLFYNAVEHVDGPTLAGALDGKPLPLRAALGLVEKLARAVHHAHQRNIVHRSLKPACVLLKRIDDCRLQIDDWQKIINHQSAIINPKITDFGLTRRPVEGDTTDAELQGELPYYLSPEQAWGRAKEIGPATDVYALGAILYELAGGRPPFRGSTASEVLDAVQCREAPPLRVRGDVDAVCRKCLAKQPRRRYASALDLADELRRCADGYPIKARPTGNAERLAKWLRRKARPLAVLLLGLVLGGAAVGLLPRGNRSSAQMNSLREQNYRHAISRLESELVQARRRQTAAEYLHHLTLAERELNGGDPARAREYLSRCPAERRRWEWRYLDARSRGEDVAAVFEAEKPVACADLSLGGTLLVIGTGEGEPAGPRGKRGGVSVWDVTTRKRLWRADVARPLRAVAVHPDSFRFASTDGSEVQVRDVGAFGRATASRAYPRSRLTSLAYVPDTPDLVGNDTARLLVAGGDGFVRVLQEDLRTRELRELFSEQPPVFRHLWPPGDHARLLPLPPQRDRIALVSSDGSQVVILSSLNGRHEDAVELRGHEGAIRSLAFSEQRQILAMAGENGAIYVWNVNSPSLPPAVIRAHQRAVTGVAFSGDGDCLASCGADGTLRLWDPQQGIELLALRGYAGASGVLFRSDTLAVLHGDKVTVLKPQ